MNQISCKTEAHLKLKCQYNKKPKMRKPTQKGYNLDNIKWFKVTVKEKWKGV